MIVQHHRDTPKTVTPIITGPATRAYTVSYDAGDQWFGLRLRPESGAALWKGAMAQATDTVLRGQEAIDLVPPLAELDGRHLTLKEIAPLVLDHTAQSVDTRLTRALDVLHASGGRIRMTTLAGFLSCSTRQLNRLFRANTGLSTKTYAQLIQFHRTLGLITRARLPITAAAFEGGYADHAHMTRAFGRFGGFAPSRVPPDLTLPQLFPQ
ncbi:helix-turn-helix protein [Yoonia maricola]|uniref:Helix-turn-helix protein n=1 Tax=Yoonia maricola TaxID=420999 RepID=A0A2M8WNH8_9RHOB|nr:helix-turn-helix protein [Yoonia maricola]